MDKEWEKIRKIVFERDNYSDQIYKCISALEGMYLKAKAPFNLLQIIDPAHIFPKGVYPSLKYDPDNVVLLNRYSHQMIDDIRDPIFGKQLSSEEHERWWIKIIGLDKYNSLLLKLNRPIILKGDLKWMK